LEISSSLNVAAITGKKASFSILLNNREPEILHLATHSGTNHLGPWLRFSETDVSTTTIMNEKIKPQLVVLASCGSGTPYNSNLWGSLGGSFLSSGSPAVIATLWSVEDQMTREMMQIFYTNYFEGFSSAESLRHAQQWAIKQGKEVQQWAAFTLMGIPGELSKATITQSANVH
jgi:CHAT domain-containing protein